MPFIYEARRAVAALSRRDPMRITLQFLLTNAVGRENAVPWPQLREHLRREGVPMSKNVFQTSILKQTREGDVFIASGSQGFFLIADRDDAVAMREFYERRIASERARLRRLQRLAQEQGWNW
jgi:hypothetical protein